MRITLLSVLAFWAMLFLVQACQDDLAFSHEPPSQEIARATSSFQVTPGHVAFAILRHAGIQDAAAIVWPKTGSNDCSRGTDPWGCITEKLGNDFMNNGKPKSGTDTTATDPWGEINEGYGEGTSHKNDSTASDPWDTILEGYYEGTRHTGRPKSDSTATDPWGSIQAGYGEGTSNANRPKSESKTKRQQFYDAIARVKGQHGHEELVLLAIVVKMELRSFQELQEVFAVALGECPGGGCPDLFLAPSILNRNGIFTAAAVSGHHVQLHPYRGMTPAVYTLQSPYIRRGDIITFYPR